MAYVCVLPFKGGLDACWEYSSKLLALSYCFV